MSEDILMAYRDTEHDDHSHGHVSYIAVFLALCIFTGISVLADIVTLPNAGVKAVVVMAVAVAKATCVMLFFMRPLFINLMSLPTVNRISLTPIFQGL